MQSVCHYRSPLGEILLAAQGPCLTGLWFEGQKYFPQGLEKGHEEKETPVLTLACAWLELYFSGREPGFEVPVSLAGTEFQRQIWEILRAIPYGQVRTYGEIARELAARRGSAGVPARAVGGAVGRNRISLIVPCHRVVGADGSLTGYAGGMDRKRALLELEGRQTGKAGVKGEL